MVSLPGEKFRRYGAFKVFDRPISPVAPGIQDDPTWFLRVNEDYMAICNGALGALARPETWDTTDGASSLDATGAGHDILNAWQPWSAHISVPDWELVNLEAGTAVGVMYQRGENATGPFSAYAWLQSTHTHVKFRDITSHADVGGLLTQCYCYTVNFDGAQILAQVTPCAGLIQSYSSFYGIDLKAQMGGTMECKEIQVWCDAQLFWVMILKNNWLCGSV